MFNIFLPFISYLYIYCPVLRSQWYQEEIIIDFDRDSISALTEKRENLWAKIANASFMTLNEKRSIVGLRPLEDGDRL